MSLQQAAIAPFTFGPCGTASLHFG